MRVRCAKGGNVNNEREKGDDWVGKYCKYVIIIKWICTYFSTLCCAALHNNHNNATHIAGRKEGNCELTVILLHCQLNTHPVIPKNKTYVIVRSDNCHFLHILHIFLIFSSFISHAKQTSACQMSERMTIIFIAIDRFAIGNVMKYWSEQLDGTIDEREDWGGKLMESWTYICSRWPRVTHYWSFFHQSALQEKVDLGEREINGEKCKFEMSLFRRMYGKFKICPRAGNIIYIFILLWV